MNKAQYLKFGLTLATAVVLAACGSSGGGDNSESPSANTGSGSTPPASTPSTSGTSSGGNAGTGSNQSSSNTTQPSASDATSNSGYVSVKSGNSAVSNVQAFNANSLTSITVNGTNIQLSYPGIYSGGWLSLNGNNNCCGKFESVKVGSYNVSGTETYLYYTGVLTPENQMPTSGKAIYNGDSVYTVRNPDSQGSNITETGSAQLTADFAAKTLSGTLTHGATTISLDAQIAQNTFQGTALSNGEPGQGTVQGNFYGPNAKELGGIAKGDNWVAGFAASK